MKIRVQRKLRRLMFQVGKGTKSDLVKHLVKTMMAKATILKVEKRLFNFLTN
jgi:hypothetical protein